MTQRQFFGTDGIRGKVGEPPISADWILKLGWAAGRVLAKEGRGKVVIGKDTRLSGYMFESALEAGLAAAGLDICLLGPMPTPAIAYLTRTLHAKAGIVISASHNPYDDNGIKFFSEHGLKLSDEVEHAIEAMLDQPLQTVAPAEIGKAQRINDAGGRYIEFCKGTLDHGVDLKGLRIVIDCAHGATYHVAENVFAELGATVITMGANPDGLNINRECGSTHPEALAEKVLAEKADVGIAFDGDGDRTILVDHTGAIVDGDELLCIIAHHYQQQGRLNGGVVGTLMSNYGLELAFKKMNIPFYRAKVGDRYVMGALKERHWILGGESSGHIICLDANTTGDGIIAALRVLVAMIKSGQSLHDLKQLMDKLPQVLINVRVENKNHVMNEKQVQAALLQAEQDLAGQGRILLRPSGTEPLIRVMTEGSDPSTIAKIAHAVAETVKEACGVGA